MSKKILVISPHADDATIFIGGIIKKLTNAGNRVYIARVTNDDYDAYSTDKVTAIINNREEAERAYSVLGVNDVIHMGYESDYMNSVDYSELRGNIVELIRAIRPYELYNFDIDGKNEDNMDHKVIAGATAEALWISSFTLHYKEQFNDRVSPYSVPKRMKYSRECDNNYNCVDISDVMDDKIKALSCHKSAMHNMLMQSLLRAESYGQDISQIINNLDIDVMIDNMARKQANMIGNSGNMQYAELLKEESMGLAEFFI